MGCPVRKKVSSCSRKPESLTSASVGRKPLCLAIQYCGASCMLTSPGNSLRQSMSSLSVRGCASMKPAIVLRVILANPANVSSGLFRQWQKSPSAKPGVRMQSWIGWSWWTNLDLVSYALSRALRSSDRRTALCTWAASSVKKRSSTCANTKSANRFLSFTRLPANRTFLMSCAVLGSMSESSASSLSRSPSG